MSRVAKKPIALPKGVEFNNQSGNLSVKGPKGTLSIAQPEGVDVKVEDGNLLFSANDESKMPLAGTMRAILANMVQGVTDGFEKKLEIQGVGYRAALRGRDLELALGLL